MSRDPFVWRRAEEGLLGRRPDAEVAEAEHHHSNCNHKDGGGGPSQGGDSIENNFA